MDQYTVASISGLDRADLLRVLGGLPFGVAVLDSERRALFLNPALEGLTGFSSAEVAGVPCRHVLRGSFCLHDCPCPPRGQACLAGGNRSREGTLINRNRRKIPVRLTSLPVTDRSGEFLCSLDVIEDLSALKDMETRLSVSASPGQIVGRCAVMEHLLRILPAVAQSDAPVLLTGESGTGKDLLAEALHRLSPRARESFVRVNATPMPEALLDAELFGQAEGPGGAPRPGKFQLAQNGTLFLSEIADMPLAQQGRLLRLLDERAVLPAGGDRPMQLNVRVVAATGRDPEDMVRQGLLREDLFHRLNAVRLHLPPLRERGEDVPFLLAHFLKLFAAKFRKPVTGFSDEAQQLLAAYDFPGNVRELRNLVEYAVMVCPKDTVRTEHLPLPLRFPPAAAPKASLAEASQPQPDQARKPARKKG